MKSTSRLRVLSDRIPRVLVFVYFCRGLSGNTEERPTRRDYIEILTCRAIILHLEDSRSHGKKAQAERGQAQVARPGDLGARSLLDPVQDSLSTRCSTDLLDQEKHSTTSPTDLKTHRGGGLYKETPLAPGEDKKFIIELRGALEGKPLL